MADLQVPLDAPKQILKQLEQALQAAAKRVVATKPKADAVLNSQIQQTHNPDSPG